MPLYAPAYIVFRFQAASTIIRAFVATGLDMSGRVNHQPIFLLTALPWRENSLRVEAFSRDFGRVSLLARSARTRGSELRGVLLPFVPISASWFGKEELKTVHRAEWRGGWAQPVGQRLMSALYVNELVLKLTAREDGQPELFAALHDVLRAICTAPHFASALRCFEWRLLTLLGFAPDWARDADGRRVAAAGWYAVQPETAVQAVGDGDLLLDFKLPDELHSRKVLQQLNGLKRGLKAA